VSNAAQLAEPQAINLLMHRVIADHLYRGANRGCIAFQGEGTGAKYVHIAVREDHHPWCGGDPNVEPVIDRFVVDFDTEKSSPLTSLRSRRTIWWHTVDSRPYVDWGAFLLPPTGFLA
jgi:hypothetical protein